MNENEPVDKRFLIVVLIFGLSTGGGTAQWLQSGEIALRSTSRGQVAPTAAAPFARIPRQHVLFYPVCTMGALLATSMIVFPVLAFIRNDHQMGRLCAYSCVALLVFAFATSITAVLVTPG